MRDEIYLLVDGKRIENFLSYKVEADIYTADDAFSLELSNPEIKIRTGLLCELWVNNDRELVGIIDRVSQSYDKQGRKLTVEGRDLCGLLVDSYCEEFITVEGMKLKALAERLLKKITFINRNDIEYQDNIKGNLKKKKGAGSSFLALQDGAQNFSHIEPGQTIFEVLKIYAMSRGMIFYALPSGKLVFGKPKDGGDTLFRIVTRKNAGEENNVLEGELVEDISKRYSQVTVVGQQQGTDSTGTTAINTKASIPDKSWPFYDDKGKLRLYKPYVAKDNNDSRSPKLHGQMLLEKMKQEGFQLNYKVAGHSQNGRNWTINEMCHVTDEVFEIDSSFLIYGRTIELSKEQGVITTLKLGYPGRVQ